MQNHSHHQPQQRPPSSAEADFLAERVRTGLSRRGSAPTDTEVLRLVKALSRLQPAALSALASSSSADPEEAFFATLQSLGR
ncbi:MAG: hypothetical protein Q7U05_10930 [Polaromonas sp.]|jgi:hypothetical protein|nr:hypothetical protein [Polaromonas sp.]